MIDFHSHILPNVDDGSKSFDESLEMLQSLEKLGFSKIILTPHFTDNNTLSRTNSLRDSFNVFRDSIKETGINLELKLGSEILVSDSTIDQVRNKYVFPIFDNFLLVETTLNGRIQDFIDKVFELQLLGYSVIFAHPERYTELQDNPELFHTLKKHGVYFQIDLGSLIGEHGNKAKKLSKYMLKNDFVDFFGTDIHSSQSIVIKKFKKIRNIIRRYNMEDILLRETMPCQAEDREGC